MSSCQSNKYQTCGPVFDKVYSPPGRARRPPNKKIKNESEAFRVEPLQVETCHCIHLTESKSNKLSAKYLLQSIPIDTHSLSVVLDTTLSLRRLYSAMDGFLKLLLVVGQSSSPPRVTSKINFSSRDQE